MSECYSNLDRHTIAAGKLHRRVLADHKLGMKWTPVFGPLVYEGVALELLSHKKLQTHHHAPPTLPVSAVS